MTRQVTRTGTPQRGTSGAIAAAVMAATMVGATALTGCSHKGVDNRPTNAADNAQVVTARKQAGIADCPVSDQGAQAIPKGLPALVLDCMGYDSRVNVAGLAKGKPMVINFWAQWCGPCREEGPWFGAVWRKAKPGGKLVMIGVNEADKYPTDAVAMAKSWGQTYPMLVDASGAAEVPMGFKDLPQTFFFDGQGRLVHRQVGQLGSQAELEQEITKYLGVRLG